jgi:hypothetical protein
MKRVTMSGNSQEEKTSMGMDVIGRAPTSERGKYFENNSSWWHPLATYCKEVAPEIVSGCRHWHTNDGDGLDAGATSDEARHGVELNSPVTRHTFFV